MEDHKIINWSIRISALYVVVQELSAHMPLLIIPIFDALDVLVYQPYINFTSTLWTNGRLLDAIWQQKIQLE